MYTAVPRKYEYINTRMQMYTGVKTYQVYTVYTGTQTRGRQTADSQVLL